MIIDIGFGCIHEEDGDLDLWAFWDDGVIEAPCRRCGDALTIAEPASMAYEPDILAICANLHEWRTGSNDATYASWGPDPGGEERDIETLHRRLREWREIDTPWRAYDEAVRQLLRVVLMEYGEVPE